MHLSQHISDKNAATTVEENAPPSVARYITVTTTSTVIAHRPASRICC